MATRFYFRDTTAAEPKPNVKLSGLTFAQYLTSTLGGGQDSATNIYPCDMLTTAGASNVTIGTSLTETGAAHDGWVKAFISPALVAQTLTGTIAFVADFNEGSAFHNMNPRIWVYVWKADDSGPITTPTEVFGKLSDLEADITQGSLQTFTFVSYTISDTVVSAGDRIYIEVTFNDNNTKTAAYDHIVGLNGAAASGYESYIEFSMNIAFAGASYSQKITEAITASETNSGAVQRMKKKFVMRFGNNAGRPKEGITVGVDNSGAVQRFKKKFLMTFKNATDRTVQGLTVVDKLVSKRWSRTFLQSLTAGDRRGFRQHSYYPDNTAPTVLYLRGTGSPDATAVGTRPTVKQNGYSMYQSTSDADPAVAIVCYDMTPDRRNLSSYESVSLSEAGAPHYCWHRAYISPPLQAQTVGGEVTSYLYLQRPALTGTRACVYLYVWKGDNSGVRGVLADLTPADGQSVTSITNYTGLASQHTLSNVACLNGDRIVAEIYAWDNNTSGASRTHTFLEEATTASSASCLIFNGKIKWAHKWWPTEAISIGTVLVERFRRRLIQSISVVDKALSVVKSGAGVISKALIESLYVTSNLFKRITKVSLQSMNTVATSSLNNLRTLILAQGVRVADDIWEEALKKVFLSMGISVVASITRRKFWKRLPQGFTLVDTFTTRGSKWIRKFIQGVTVVDRVMKRFKKKLPTQSLGVTDWLRKKFIEKRSDSLTLSALISKRKFWRRLFQGFTLGQTISTRGSRWVRKFGQGMTVSVIFAGRGSFKRTFQQGVTVGNVLLKRIRRPITDSFKVAGTLSRKNLWKRTAQPLRVVDAYFSTRGSKWVRTFSQGITVAGQPFKRITRRITQYVQVFGSLKKHAAQRLTQSIGVVANLTKRNLVRKLSQAIQAVATATSLITGVISKKLVQGMTVSGQLFTSFFKRISQSVTVTGLASIFGAVLVIALSQGISTTTALVKRFERKFTQSMTVTVLPIKTFRKMLSQLLTVAGPAPKPVILARDLIDVHGFHCNAVQSGNVIYVCYQGSGRDPYIVKFDGSTWSSPVKIADTPLPSDGHGAPAIVRSADGKLHVFFGNHDSLIKYYTSNPDDIATWTDTSAKISSDQTGPGSTYSLPFIDPNTGKLFYFFRRLNNSYWSYLTSVDNGVTWSDSINFVTTNPDDIAYFAYIGHYITQVGGHSCIHFGWVMHITASNYRKNFYYARFDMVDGHFYTIGGTDLGTSIADGRDARCLVLDSGGLRCYFGSTTFSSGGVPLAVVNYEYQAGQYRYVSLEWDGASWTNQRTITNSTTYEHIPGALFTTTTNKILFIVTPDEADLQVWEYDFTAKSWSRKSNFANQTDCPGSGNFWSRCILQPTTTKMWLYQEVVSAPFAIAIGMVGADGNIVLPKSLTIISMIRRLYAAVANNWGPTGAGSGVTTAIKVVGQMTKLQFVKKLLQGVMVAGNAIKGFRKVVIPGAWESIWRKVVWASDGETKNPPGTGLYKNTWQDRATGLEMYMAQFYGLHHNVGGVSGQYGDATYVDGLTDGTYGVINSSDSSKFDLTDKITIVAWVLIPNVFGNGIIIQKKGTVDGNFPWVLGIDATKHPYFYINQHLGDNGPVCADAITPYVYHQIVATYDKSIGKVRIAVDDDAAWTEFNYTVDMALTDNKICFAGTSLALLSNFRAYYDDIIILNDTITLSEVQQLYNSSKGLNLNSQVGFIGGMHATDVFKRKHSAVRKFVQGLTLTQVIVTEITVRLVSITSLAGTFPRPARVATFSLMIEDGGGTPLPTCIVSVALTRPDGVVWKTLSLVESVHTPGLYSADFRILGSDQLGAYPFTVTATYKKLSSGTHSGFLTIFQGPYAGIHFR